VGKNTRTILICSGKGGVGKTTLTANLGIALANSGASTAVLDADFGLRNLDLLLGLENRIIYTAQDVLDKNCRLDQALVRHKKEPNLALLPAGDPRMLDWMKPEDMKKISELLSKNFDFVLVDCPAGVEDGFKNALAACKEAIVVTTPQQVSLQDARRGLAMFKQLGVPLLGIVENMSVFIPPDMPSKKYEIFGKGGGQTLAEENDLPLLAQIPIEIPLVDESNKGIPISISQPNKESSIEFCNLAQLIKNQFVHK